MSTSDYERYRRRLEEELRSDVELIYASYLAKLRAYETVARVRGEIEGDAPPLGALTLRLPAPLAALPAAASPAPPPAPVGPPATRKRRAFEVVDAIEEALGRVGEIFDKDDLCRAMGFAPPRATLFSALDRLVTEGVIALHERGGGKRPTRYRKLEPAAVAPPPA